MSAVMVLDDPDAEVGLGYTYLHWAVTDLPVVGSLPFNASALGNIDGDEVYPYVALCPRLSFIFFWKFFMFKLKKKRDSSVFHSILRNSVVPISTVLSSCRKNYLEQHHRPR